MKGKNILLIFVVEFLLIENIFCILVTSQNEKPNDVMSRDEGSTNVEVLIPTNQQHLVAPDQSKLTLAMWTEWHQGPCYTGIETFLF